MVLAGCSQGYTSRGPIIRQKAEVSTGMATYAEISRVTHEIGGFTPATCWIAHVKEQMGLPVRRAPNRQDTTLRVKPCPPEKKSAIVAAMRRLKML
jgi:hypothetical protein